MDYHLIYWKKGLAKNSVKVRSYENQQELDNFLKDSKDQFDEHLVCQKIRERNGLSEYRLLNRGAYVTYKVIAYIISITVMVAIVIGLLYMRSRYLKTSNKKTTWQTHQTQPEKSSELLLV